MGRWPYPRQAAFEGLQGLTEASQSVAERDATSASPAFPGTNGPLPLAAMHDQRIPPFNAILPPIHCAAMDLKEGSRGVPPVVCTYGDAYPQTDLQRSLW